MRPPFRVCRWPYVCWFGATGASTANGSCRELTRDKRSETLRPRSGGFVVYLSTLDPQGGRSKG